MVEGQSIDYAAICAEKKGPSLYPSDMYTLRKEVMNLHAMQMQP
jgi:hypothetical protein